MSVPRPFPLLLCCAGLLAGAVALAAPAPPKAAGTPARAPATPAQEEFFETKVRPVLARRCGGCHEPAKPGGGLALSGRGALLQGGKRGPAVVPGKPEESLLLRAVSHGDPALKMPPAGR
jgi:hypothetical protein